MWSNITLIAFDQLPDFSDKEFTPILELTVVQGEVHFILLGWTHEPKSSSSVTIPRTTLIDRTNLLNNETKHNCYSLVTLHTGTALALTKIGSPEESKIRLANLAQKVIERALANDHYDREVEADTTIYVWDELITVFSVHIQMMSRSRVTPEIFAGFCKLLRKGVQDHQNSSLQQVQEKTERLLNARM